VGAQYIEKQCRNLSINEEFLKIEAGKIRDA
jgi:hypothetical protein